MPDDPICAHVRAGEDPLEVRLTFDDHLGFADGLARCRHCGAAYLLELLDLDPRHRVFRIAPVSAAHAERLIRDLTRGSCDLERGGAEAHHLRTSTTLARALLLTTGSGLAVETVASVPADVRIPSASWRELPCDGTWIRFALAHTP